MLVGSAAVWPFLSTAAPQTIPVIGYLGSQSPDRELLARFHRGLNEFGYFEGPNVKIEYRWAFGQYKKLPALAGELVQRQVALIVTSGGSVAAKAAREATSTIPILFISGLDPIREHLVTSLSRPGGNATGLRHYTVELMSKRLELLKGLLPNDAPHQTRRIGCLINDDSTGLEDLAQIQEIKDMAGKLGLQRYFARTDKQIEVEFASMAREQISALLVEPDPLFNRQRALIVGLAARYAIPTGYRNREFVQAGGLMSYGPNLSESWQQIGEYAGRILDGARPEDLPVMLPMKYELVINKKTAKALGLNLKRTLADEIID